jgi:hypothetical protein
MKRIKLALNLKGLDPSGTELYANSVWMALTNNPHYPGAAPYLSQLATGISDLRTAITAPHPQAITIQNKVGYIEKVLVALKGHVELECGDDEEKALTSGFSLRQSPGARSKSFDVTQGKTSGSVDLVCPNVNDRAAYVWEITNDISASTGWSICKVTNTTSTQIKNLNPGVKYWFRVKAVVHDEDQPYSDPHMVHVV